MFFNQSIHKDGSFVKMSSILLKAKCEAKLVRIQESRARKRQQAIEDYRQEMISGFWHRLLKRPVPTDEEVIAYATRPGGDCIAPSELWFASIAHASQEEIANKLLNACKHAEEVFVSTEDLEVVS